MAAVRSIASLSLLVLLAGCGRAASPAVPVAPLAPVAPGGAGQATAAAAEAAPGDIITSHTGRVAPTVTALAGPAALLAGPDAAVAEEAPPAAALAAAPAEGMEDPAAIAAYMAAEDPPSYNVDDRTPFNVVVAERSAKTATIAWHTEVATKGVIEYGRAWGFDDNGFTHKFVDDVAKTDHQITLTELRRWTGYVYRVTAVTPLGLKFPEKDRKFRTKFWSWR